jgi:hypothetical protein
VWAAIAYRRALTLALLALSALITACAVFAPLYERSLEQSLLRDGLTQQSQLNTDHRVVGNVPRRPAVVGRQGHDAGDAGAARRRGQRPVIGSAALRRCRR